MYKRPLKANQQTKYISATWTNSVCSKRGCSDFCQEVHEATSTRWVIGQMIQAPPVASKRFPTPLLTSLPTPQQVVSRAVAVLSQEK